MFAVWVTVVFALLERAGAFDGVERGRALDLLWTSDRIDAARALEIGLVEYICVT